MITRAEKGDFISPMGSETFNREHYGVENSMSASNRKLPKIDSWADFLNGLDQHDEHGTLQLPGMESFEPANDCVNSKEQVSWSQSHTLVNLFMRRAGKPSLLPESVNAQIPVPSHNTINGPSGSDAKLAPPGNVPRSSSGPATFPLDRTAATKRSREDIQSRHLTETPSVPETRSMTTAVPSPSYFATMQNKRHKSEPPRKPAGQGMTMTHDQIVTQYGRLVQKHAQLESDHKKIVLNLTTQSGKMLRLKTTMARQ
eukprot:276061-Amorphochlora_amoeboformis.AAC.2